MYGLTPSLTCHLCAYFKVEGGKTLGMCNKIYINKPKHSTAKACCNYSLVAWKSK